MKRIKWRTSLNKVKQSIKDEDCIQTRTHLEIPMHIEDLSDEDVGDDNLSIFEQELERRR